MSIVSRGDQIRPGRYQLHSRFSKAINFANGEWLLSLVSEEVGAGPVNLVMRKLLEAPLLHDLQVDEDGRRLWMRGAAFDLSAVELYDSCLPPCVTQFDHWKQHLPLARQTLAAAAPPESLAFLLDDNRRGEFQGAFKAGFARRITESLQQLLYGDLLAGVRGFKGCGLGLTPSGDDFIAGLLLALSCMEQAGGPPAPLFGNAISRIAQEARGESFLANAFLALASRGRVFARTKALFQALAEGAAAAVIAATESALQVGATSGADLLVGLLLGLEHKNRFTDMARAGFPLSR